MLQSGPGMVTGRIIRRAARQHKQEKRGANRLRLERTYVACLTGTGLPVFLETAGGVPLEPAGCAGSGR